MNSKLDLKEVVERWISVDENIARDKQRQYEQTPQLFAQLKHLEFLLANHASLKDKTKAPGKWRY